MACSLERAGIGLATTTVAQFWGLSSDLVITQCIYPVLRATVLPVHPKLSRAGVALQGDDGNLASSRGSGLAGLPVSNILA